MSPSEAAECLSRAALQTGGSGYAAAVNLVLVHQPWPGLVVVERPARLHDPWGGDTVLPGGRLKPGEDPVAAALRETVEEACIPLDCLEPLGVIGAVEPRNAPWLRVAVVASLLRGPDCLEALRGCRGPETAWTGLLGLPCRLETTRQRHPRRGIIVEGYRDWYGTLVWGMTLRAIRLVHEKLRQCGLCRTST